MIIKFKNISLSTFIWCFYVIEKGEELWLMLIIYIISKRNNSANVILLCNANDWVSVLFNLSPLASVSIIKRLVL